MTAGRAIAHAEQSPVPHPGLLHGAQLWIALPEVDRGVAPGFEQHTELPVLTDRGLRATVLVGELAGAVSPGAVFSPLLGGEPFAEQIVMWWNFVAASSEEIVRARRDWMSGHRFGPVLGYDGQPLAAPRLPDVPLKPRGRTR